MISLALLPMLLLGPPQSRALLTQEEVARLEVLPGMPTSKVIKVKFHPKMGITIRGIFYITSKGNGCLEISGLSILIYDAHEDGVTFEGELLNNEVTDVNGDGCNDLVLSGIAIVQDSSNEKSIRRVPIRAVFLFDPISNRLKPSINSPHIPVN